MRLVEQQPQNAKPIVTVGPSHEFGKLVVDTHRFGLHALSSLDITCIPARHAQAINEGDEELLRSYDVPVHQDKGEYYLDHCEGRFDLRLPDSIPDVVRFAPITVGRFFELQPVATE